MNYFVKRGDQQYGPYTLAELQLFTQQGHIAPTDLARSEAMEEWMPASQIVGNINIPAPGSPAFGATFQGASPVPMAPGNAPPDLHWGVVLALSIVTCSLFGIVWSFVEAAYVRKIRRESNALLYLGLYAGCVVAKYALAFSGHDYAQAAPFVSIISVVFYVSAAFSMRSALEDYYNSDENIGLHLNGIMTFFFSVYYFQYHFNRINQWKRTGVLQPQNT
jgi:hypothetical protein